MKITLDTETASPELLTALALELNDTAEFMRDGVLEAGGPAADPAPADPAPADPAPARSAAGVELDSAGLPWDGRIHSREKKKLKNGTWRKKRGVDDALVAQVEAELRQAMGAKPTNPAPAAAPADPATPAPAPAAAPAEDDPLAGLSFPDFMQTTVAAGIEPATTLAACKKHGIASVALLGANPAMIPTIYRELFPGT